MTTSLKKLLLVSVTLILGVMSSRVMATPTTNYDFTTLSSGPTVSGSAVSSDGTVYTSLNNVMFGSNSIASGDIYFIGSGISNYGLVTNGAGYPMAQYVFQYGGDYYHTVAIGNPSGFSGQTVEFTTLAAAQSGSQTGNIGIVSFTSATFTCTSGCSGGAPEIDGSLAPKVGFLLGCLFLMFGRKKQNSEALITV